MSNGRLEQIATPEELYNQPRTRFVAEFVGLTNKLDAQVDGPVATILDSKVPVLDGSIATGAGTALVRPEFLSVGRGDGANAALVSRFFLGPVSRVTCDLDSGVTVTAQLSSSEATELSPGDRVKVTVSPTPVLVVSTD